MEEFDAGQNRRKYPRFKAPILYRSAPFFSRRKPSVNIGLGGIRIYSDDELKMGKRLELELMLPDDTLLTCMAKVVWQKELPEDAEARYDIGLQFLDMPDDGVERLSSVLDKHASAEDNA